MLINMKCNCGLPAKYSHAVKGNSCNKYGVCLSYDELLENTRKDQVYLAAYISFISEIDDYFEYRNESLSDRKKVHQLLGNLTDKLMEINNG